MPLPHLAKFFHDVGGRLVIEFVSKSDSQVKKLLASRQDMFNEYHREGFEQAFKEYFAIREKAAVQDSERWLYLMERRA